MQSTADKIETGSPEEQNSNVTKAVLSSKISTAIGLKPKEAMEVVESVLDTIRETLIKGEDVLISGFGKFVVMAKRERVGRNPQTGLAVTIAARKVLRFRPSEVFKKGLNEVA